MRLLKKPIFWILLFALALRLWGIDYGFPFFLVNDEPALVLGALKMLELKTLVPAWHQDEFRKVLNYSPLPSYFYLLTLSPVIATNYAFSGFPPLDEYKDDIALNPTFLWVAARVLNALMGVALILVIYLMSKKITGSERAGLFAALFLALSFYHLQLSQVVRHWMPASLLVYLGWFWALDIGKTRSAKPYFLSGLFVGLAGGVNTSSAIGLWPGLLTHFWDRSRSWKEKLASPPAVMFAGTALVVALLFVALYPYGLTRGEGAETVSGDIWKRFGFLSDKSLAEWLTFLADYAKLFVRYETTLAFAALVGAWLLFRRQPLFVVTVLSFSVIYFSSLYLFFNAIPRAMVFILPASAVLGGYGVDRLMLKAQNYLRPTLASLALVFGAAFLIFFFYPLLVDGRYLYLFSRKDTRLVARDWIEKNIPPGTKITADLPYLRLINTKDGISRQERLDPSGLRSQDRALLRRGGERYPAPAYDVLNLHFLSPTVSERITASPAYFRQFGFKYVVVEYEYADRSDMFPTTRRLVENLSPVKHFSPSSAGQPDRSLDLSGEISSVGPLELFQFERFGQFVDVYAL